MQISPSLTQLAELRAAAQPVCESDTIPALAESAVTMLPQLLPSASELEGLVDALALLARD